MKKINFFLLLGTFITSSVVAQNVGIGTSTPHSSAMLDISSTNKGVLVPRMTTAQRTAIASPANGLMVYDTDTKTVWYYNGSNWTNMAAPGGGTLSLPFDQAVNIGGNAFRISNGALGNTAILGESYFGTGLTGKTNEGIGINAVSTTGTALKAQSGAGFAIEATSTGNVAIKGSATNANGILGITNAVSRAGVRGEATVNGSDGVAGYNTASGVGVRGESNTGLGMSAYSTSGTGLAASSISGTGIYANSISGLALNVAGNLKISGGNTNPSAGAVLTSDANGNATWKPTTHIGFKAAGIADPAGITNLVISSPSPFPVRQKVEFAAQNYDFGNGYTVYNGSETNSSSTFTISVAGVYHFDASILFLYATAFDYREIEVSLMLRRNGVEHELSTSGNYINDVDNTQVTLSTDVQLQQGDVVWIAARQFNLLSIPSYLVNHSPQNFFNGHLLFAN